MELNLHFTFEKNDTFAAVAAGKYENIRFFHMNHNPMPYRQMAWLVNESTVLSNWTVADHSAVLDCPSGRSCGDQCPKGTHGKTCTDLDQFSAACW